MEEYQGRELPYIMPMSLNQVPIRAVYYMPPAHGSLYSFAHVTHGTTTDSTVTDQVPSSPPLSGNIAPRPSVIQYVDQNQRVDARPQCPVCNHKFSKLGSLRVHMRIHTGEKPYQCQFCPKAFAQSGNLATHMRIHTGERPYKCHYCEKRFTQSSAHKNHVMMHFRKMGSISEALLEAASPVSPSH